MAIRSIRNKQLSSEDLQALVVTLTRVIQALSKWAFQNISGMETTDYLMYRDAIQYFIEQRPDDDRIIKGAILIKNNNGKIITHWLYLDVNNKPLAGETGKLYGRALIVKAMDEELREAFGDCELMLFE